MRFGTVRRLHLRNPVLKNLDFAEERVILMTTHRRETGVADVADSLLCGTNPKLPDVRVVFRFIEILEFVGGESALSDLPGEPDRATCI